MSQKKGWLIDMKFDFIVGDFWSMDALKDKSDKEICDMVNPILNKPITPEYVAKMREISSGGADYVG